MLSTPPVVLPAGRPRVLQGSFAGGRLRVVAPHVQGGAAQLRMAGTAMQLPAGLFAPPPPGAGQRLPEVVQRRMEDFFGADFSGVRVHAGSQAAALGAFGFALGSDLYFAPGRYLPGSPHGLRLLAHELAHVVQQRAGRARNPFGAGIAVVQDPGLEAEAERMALKAAAVLSRPLPPPAAPAVPASPAPRILPASPAAPAARFPPAQPRLEPGRSGTSLAPHVAVAVAAGRGTAITPGVQPKRAPHAPPLAPPRWPVPPATIQRMERMKRMESEESEDEYLPPEEEDYVPEEYLKLSKSRDTCFYSHTRPNLEKEQTHQKILHSGKGGKGLPMKMKQYKGKWVEDRKFQDEPHQPTIDHIIDWLVLEPAVDTRIHDNCMSDAEGEEYKKYAYSYQENLQILSKVEDLSKKRFTKDTAPPSLWKKGEELADKILKDFYNAAEIQKKRTQRRTKLKKKKGTDYYEGTKKLKTQ